MALVPPQAYLLTLTLPRTYKNSNTDPNPNPNTNPNPTPPLSNYSLTLTLLLPVLGSAGPRLIVSGAFFALLFAVGATHLAQVRVKGRFGFLWVRFGGIVVLLYYILG